MSASFCQCVALVVCVGRMLSVSHASSCCHVVSYVAVSLLTVSFLSDYKLFVKTRDDEG